MVFFAAGDEFSQNSMIQKRLMMTEPLRLCYSPDNTKQKLSSGYRHDRFGIAIKHIDVLLELSSISIERVDIG